MTPVEVTRIVTLIQAVCPTQHVVEDTALVWGPVLGDTDYADALDAVKALAQQQRFIAPSEIITVVRGVRLARIERVGVPMPNVDPDDVTAYAAEARALTQAVGDGRMGVKDRVRYELGGLTVTEAEPFLALGDARPRPVAALVSGAFHTVQ